ncbi:MAG: bifunctional adenosylcobinamide kinase/adenosylcobinamide-phosphate guanylyltransferase [Jatrophihabitans sp.]|uniref:bifunctional adenosylcobinamide kinase/adenosylcobinamide-phosphate guanylyltransferase n=1 Tax=Jatrophihabitans sp. TaxID=1932789 RepID=UPI003F81A11F
MTTVLVLGGARSGKSAFAEGRLAARTAVDYIATAPSVPDDPEWDARVERHRARRPDHWRTVETQDLPGALRSDGPSALVDSITAWLAATMDVVGLWREAPGADAGLEVAVDALVAAWAATTRDVVAVSDEVGLGVVPDTASGRLFRDSLGLLNQALAAAADEVFLVVAGLPLRLK